MRIFHAVQGISLEFSLSLPPSKGERVPRSKMAFLGDRVVGQWARPPSVMPTSHINTGSSLLYFPFSSPANAPGKAARMVQVLVPLPTI